MVKLKNILTLQDFFKVLKDNWKGLELVRNFNRSVLFELQKQSYFNKLINDENVSSLAQFAQKFKAKRFDKIAQTLIIHMYNYVKDTSIIEYKKDDNIITLIKNTARYIRTNANIIQMAYNLWKEKHQQETNTTDKLQDSIYNANNIEDRLFAKNTFKYTNSGQLFLFINNEFIIDENSHADYPTEDMLNQYLSQYDDIKSYAYGMQYPNNICFVVKDQNMGISSYQELKKQAEAPKIYKVLEKKRNKLMTQRMARKIL